jgi:hypothetical protein
MKTTSPTSIKLTHEAEAALKMLKCQSYGTSNADVISKTLVCVANNEAPAPTIRFGTIDPNELPFIKLEGVLAERRLREIKQMVMRVRPHDKNQAEKLSKVLVKVEEEIENYGKFRLALANLSRLGAELSPEHSTKGKALIGWIERKITSSGNEEQKIFLNLHLRILKAFFLE